MFSTVSVGSESEVNFSLFFTQLFIYVLLEFLFLTLAGISEELDEGTGLGDGGLELGVGLY